MICFIITTILKTKATRLIQLIIGRTHGPKWHYVGGLHSKYTYVHKKGPEKGLSEQSSYQLSQPFAHLP